MVWYISEKMQDFLNTEIILNTNVVSDEIVISSETIDQFTKIGGDWPLLESCLKRNIVEDEGHKWIEYDSAFQEYDEEIEQTDEKG